MERDMDKDKNINNTIKTSNISLKDNVSGLKWLYSNTTYLLKRGTYELKIYSDAQTDLDSVIVYSIGNASVSGHTYKKHNEDLEDVFNPEVSPPAQIAEYKKINPTKHILNIKNATKPYMISFAESYDPLWIAYSDTSNDSNNHNNNINNNFKTSSVPLYSVVNGFFINKTGDYRLIIEYQPQKWFIQGGIVSVITVIAILIIYFVGQMQSALHWKQFKNQIWSIIRTIIKH